MMLRFLFILSILFFSLFSASAYIDSGDGAYLFGSIFSQKEFIQYFGPPQTNVCSISMFSTFQMEGGLVDVQ